MAVSVSPQHQQPLPALWSFSPAFIASIDLMPITVGGPTPTASRQGRHMQRYGDEGDRLVAGCIPVRCAGVGCRMEDVEVLMISSSGGKGMVFPKGGWEVDETVEMAARRETVEEAGVRGALEEPLLGRFQFACGKSARQDKAYSWCTAHMFVMHVAEQLDVWPEGQRQRAWFSLADASHNCRHAWMREALHMWAQRRGWDVQLAGGSPLSPGPLAAASPMSSTMSPGLLSPGPLSRGDACVPCVLLQSSCPV